METLPPISIVSVPIRIPVKSISWLVFTQRKPAQKTNLKWHIIKNEPWWPVHISWPTCVWSCVWRLQYIQWPFISCPENFVNMCMKLIVYHSYCKWTVCQKIFEFDIHFYNLVYTCTISEPTLFTVEYIVGWHHGPISMHFTQEPTLFPL